MLTSRAIYRRLKIAIAPMGLTIALAVTVTSFVAPPAEARHRSHWRHFARSSHFEHVRHVRSIRYMRAGAPSRNFAAIVVDGNSGEILYARNENELRHPASITKVMTLYLLFEQLEQGRLRLDSNLRVSAHAASQKPTKLGLRPGATISVDDAIKAVVTRSANDMAVTIAEAIGGDEDHFAELMTRKAHALGMSRTRYVNASGLPDDAQVTTARDLTILGRAIQDRFPRYYRYFATHAFYYAGKTIVNHNHLLDRVEGMDGIKTGYTRSSGFNLLTSVKRNGHYIVAAVLGGVSAASRDRIMAGLIEDQIDNGATTRTASAISENAPPDLPLRAQDKDAKRQDEASDLPHREQEQAQEKERPAEKEATRPALAYVDSTPLQGPRLTPKLDLSAVVVPKAAVDPVRVASINPEVPLDKPRPAFVSGTPKPQPVSDARAAAKDIPAQDPSAKNAAIDGSTNHAVRAAAADASATPSTMRWVTGPAPAKDRGVDKISAKMASLKTEAATSDNAKNIEGRRPPAARSGWMIQIGATDDVAKATALLTRAKSEGARILTTAQPFTEKVQKGSETLYRARFAGLEEDSAELACKTLKRSGFSCFATKN
ncbi:MAG: serine hydrolase [Methylocella sp.]